MPPKNREYGTKVSVFQKENIFRSIENRPNTSIRQLAKKSRLSATTIHKVSIKILYTEYFMIPFL